MSSDPIPERIRVSSPIIVVLLTGVFFIPVQAAIRPVTDADIWWHLRAGQWIVEHGEVTSDDPFSTHGANQPWLAYSWLYEVLVYQLYTWIGLAGVVIYRVVLAVAVVAGLQRLVARCAPRFFVSTLLTVVAALAVKPLLNERPWLFTILFSTLTLEVLLDLREGERRWTYWVLPLVYVLWANIHIQFVYGFLLLGIGWLASYMDRGLPRHRNSLTYLGIACVLATLANPYGIRLYGVVFEYATQSTPFQVVDELMALRFRAELDWLILGLALLTAFALGRKERLTSFEVLLFTVSAILCFRARRDLWMVVLSALVILPSLSPTPTGPPTVEVFPRWLRPVAAGLALIMGAGVSWVTGPTRERLAQAEAKEFPVRAVTFVAEKLLEGPLYNHFNWGGYLIWKLPELRVAIDGRTNLHGEERIKRSIATWSGGKDWEKDPELNEANTVIAPSWTALASLLRRDGRFRMVYEDEQTVVFTRNR